MVWDYVKLFETPNTGPPAVDDKAQALGKSARYQRGSVQAPRCTRDPQWSPPPPCRLASAS